MTDILVKAVPQELLDKIYTEKQRTGQLLSALCGTCFDTIPDKPPVRKLTNGPVRDFRARDVPRKTKDRLKKIAKNRGLLKNEVYLRALECGVNG